MLVALAGCGDPIGPGPGEPPAEITELPRALSPVEETAIEQSNGFGLELLRRLHAGREADEANVFISPLSASMALGMAMNGADGETFTAMQGVLGLQDLTLEEANQAYADLIDLLLGLDPSVDFRLANSAWLKEGFPILPAYQARVEEAFDARVENVDFQDPATADRINVWAEEQTEGRITDFVEPDALRDLIALLLNAVYFKGSWTEQFDASETAPADFRRPDGSTVTVPMMHRAESGRTLFSHGEDYVAADLPYGGQAFSMTVVLPTGDQTLAGVVEGMDEARWQQVLDGLTEGPNSVSLPRFELTYDKLLNDVLEAMGMEIAFDPLQADFGRLVEEAEPGDFFIEWVKQKSFVKVDEEGTEAAAVTGVGVGVTSAPPSFRVDRPFLFAIRERLSGTILFAGTVTDPTVD